MIWNNFLVYGPQKSLKKDILWSAIFSIFHKKFGKHWPSKIKHFPVKILKGQLFYSRLKSSDLCSPW